MLQVCKIDVETKVVQHFEEAGCEFGEPVFVARPDGRGEDDGVIMCPVINMKDAREAGLVILDANTMEGKVRAKAQTRGPVTRCFHGMFAQNADKVHLY